LSTEDIDRDSKVLHVVRQTRIVDNVQVFAPPKGGKERDVPLPDSVLRDLDASVEEFPPVEITLPWKEPDGEPETVSLILVNQYGKPIRRDGFNQYVWTPALVRAKVARTLRQDGMHALRHFYASVLLDAGESIKALAEWLGTPTPRSRCASTRTCCPLAATEHEWRSIVCLRVRPMRPSMIRRKMSRTT
jgi:integrase